LKICPAGDEFCADRRTDGHTDMMKLTVTFCNFVNEHTKITTCLWLCEDTLHFLANIKFCTSLSDNDKAYSHIIVITLKISALAHASDNLKYTQYDGLLSQCSHKLWARPCRSHFLLEAREFFCSAKCPEQIHCSLSLLFNACKGHLPQW